MPKLTPKTKLEAMKEWLKENNIPYKEDYKCKATGVCAPLVVPKHRIIVNIGDDQEFFLKVRHRYFPIFIRPEDNKAKVLEKLQNTIIKSMTRAHNIMNKQKEQ